MTEPRRIPVWDVRTTDSVGVLRVYVVTSYKRAEEVAREYEGWCPEITGPHYHLVRKEGK